MPIQLTVILTSLAIINILITFWYSIRQVINGQDQLSMSIFSVSMSINALLLIYLMLINNLDGVMILGIGIALSSAVYAVIKVAHN